MLDFSSKGVTSTNHAPKVGGPNRAKPESRVRSARDLRAKLESRANSKKERERGLGRGLGEPPPPPKYFGILNFKSFNLV